MIDVDGHAIETREGDTIASAMARAGITIFSRSFKYHRPRGLYCMSGDCSHCLVTADGQPGVRACMTPVDEVRSVRREQGWPNAERDFLGILRYADPILPVGFYYKLLIRPRWAWRFAEPVIRRMAGLGSVDTGPLGALPAPERVSPDVLVVGAGPAGLAAALASADQGQQVLVVDERPFRCHVPAAAWERRVADLATRVREHRLIEVRERASAAGIFQGPMVSVAQGHRQTLVHPRRVVVATGALERQLLFKNNDLPGIWLGRGALRAMREHGLLPGHNVLLVGAPLRLATLMDELVARGAHVAATVALPGPGTLPDTLRPAGEALLEALGRRRVHGAIIERDGRAEKVACDAIVIAADPRPRDGLLRQAAGDAEVIGGGDVVEPGCSVDRAIESGTAAGHGTPLRTSASPRPPLPEPKRERAIVCPCEDIKYQALEDAWTEGFRSTELLKRYTTMTMGPCQGALCHQHLREFVATRSSEAARIAAPTTARPPARATSLAALAQQDVLPPARRSPLHAALIASGAHMSTITGRSRAMRFASGTRANGSRAQLSDFSAATKIALVGQDAAPFLDSVVSGRFADLEPGMAKRTLLLNDHGGILGDLVVARLAREEFFLSGAAGQEDEIESWIKRCILRRSSRVFAIDRTSAYAAISVAGGDAARCLGALGLEVPDAGRVHRSTRATGDAIVVRAADGDGFELHLPPSEAPAAWDELMATGATPTGHADTNRARVHHGEPAFGIDTDFDTNPLRLATQGWSNEGQFIGAPALTRLHAVGQSRALVRLALETASEAGTTLVLDGAPAGVITSLATDGSGGTVALAVMHVAPHDLPTQVRVGPHQARVIGLASLDLTRRRIHV